MIDTHSHLYLPQFDDDREHVNQRATEAGVKAIFMPAIDFNSLKQMEGINHPEIEFYKMVGLHPCEVEELREGFEKQLLDFCSREDIVGVGETGLDYHWSTDWVAEQKLSLHAHCRVAKKVQKPVIIHNRKSTEDMLSILEQEQDGGLSGIWHCFNGTLEEGKRAIDLGFHVGIGGVATFKNAGVDTTVTQLPLNKMVLETDAPYLAPAPKRGKRNEPAFMKYTAEKLAELFELSVEEVDTKTTKTAKRLFGID